MFTRKNNTGVVASKKKIDFVGETIGRTVLLITATVAAVAVVAIIAFVAREAIPFFGEGRWREFFFSSGWHPTSNPPEFGGTAVFAGSALVTAGAILLAAPIGLLAAICISDMMPFGIRQVAKPVIEILAAVPSVVYGFFALTILAPLSQSMGMESGVNALTAAVVLAVMAVPTIASVADDALQSAGRDLREASYALGATRAETLFKAVIPAASGGITAAIILGATRALGETMVVWMASGNAARIPSPWWDLTQPVRTLTATIAGEMGEADQTTGSARYHALFAMGLCLLLFAFFSSLAGEFIGRRKNLGMNAETHGRKRRFLILRRG